jgi:putative ABC transport system substrate-binding protein
MERFPEYAAEVVGLDVDVILAANSPAGLAAKNATTTIPIVIATMEDPVQQGLATSLAHPGGNITGLSLQTPDLEGKRLQLFKEALPNLARVAVLIDAAGRPHARELEMKSAETTAHVEDWAWSGGRSPTSRGDSKGEAEAGCLMSSGPKLTVLFRPAAVLVDKILKGAAPAEIPVEQPTTFEFVVNLKTAKALGLTIAPHVLALADEVIE